MTEVSIECTRMLTLQLTGPKFALRGACARVAFGAVRLAHSRLLVT